MPGPGFEWIGAEEEREVLEVLRNRWLFRYGDEKDPRFKRKVRTLEEMVEQRFSVKHALAVSSGTAALATALAALSIGPGDEVIVPGYTFIASISSVILARAVPVLAEIDGSLTLDPADVERRITPRTRAIMAVHMLCTLGKIGTYSFNIFKTINAGDGGMVVTDDDELYFRAFGFHDQGHFPSRSGVEIGNRSIIGHNFRMNELTGAVLVAQVRRLDDILGRLRELKAGFKRQIEGTPGVTFRILHDPPGECATLLTVFLPTREAAAKVAARLGTTTVSKSGWHVYSNMEQILGKKMITPQGCPFNCAAHPSIVEYRAGMLPQTDRLLERAINLSVGVVDRGLGAAFGINPRSTDEEVDRAAKQFFAAVHEAA